MIIREIILYYYLIIGVFGYSRFIFKFVILVIVNCILYTFMQTPGRTWKLMEIQKKKQNIQLKIANIRCVLLELDWTINSYALIFEVKL